MKGTRVYYKSHKYWGIIFIGILCLLFFRCKSIAAYGADYPVNGWRTENGKQYWYENGVKQGITGRGKEIYDPGSNAWYWLDAVQGGAKAVSKDVYQESSGGKWVRYDANGHMVKGWDKNKQYYFDLTTGAMIKGWYTVDNIVCYFNLVTGLREGGSVIIDNYLCYFGDDGIAYNGWLTIKDHDYWYENGIRQGYFLDDNSYRGKEIYDSASNAWYWLDAVQNGAKAVSKDVYQESSGGKWVRYDADGHMIKGWNSNINGTYYFDLTTGAMNKGWQNINGDNYFFDENTGILQNSNSNSPNFYTSATEFGTVSGNITYYYNAFRGNVADTNSVVILIAQNNDAPSKMPVLYSYVDWNIPSIMEDYNDYGIFVTKVDGMGQYYFNNIPVGQYKTIVISGKTTNGSAFKDRNSYISEIAGYGKLCGLNSANAQFLGEDAGYHKYTTSSVNVSKNRNYVFSYDFGITYI